MTPSAVVADSTDPIAFTVYGTTRNHGTGVLRLEQEFMANGKSMWKQRPLHSRFGYESCKDVIDCLRCDYVSNESYNDVMKWIRLDFQHYRIIERDSRGDKHEEKIM